MRIIHPALVLALVICTPAAGQDDAGRRKQARLTADLVRWSATESTREAPRAVGKPASAADRSGARAAVKGTYLKDDSGFHIVRLEPKTPRSAAGGGEAGTTVARIWNQYGGMLEVLSRRLDVKPSAAVAVIAAESGGKALENGRPVIRFENHKFWTYWGKRNQNVFNLHFRFRMRDSTWRDHAFRATPAGEWIKIHGHGQAREWAVYNFAQGLNAPAAALSTSWGMGQVMGFNHERLGYSTPDAMARSFTDSALGAHMQILGMFDFVLNGKATSRALTAFRNCDWHAFAEQYNGAENAAAYAKKLRRYYDAAAALSP
jgi:hypothetical protein